MTRDSENAAEDNLTGFTIAQEPLLSTDVEITLEGQPPSKVWETIATHESFQSALVSATRELTSNVNYQNQSQKLRDIGVTACNHLYADVVSNLLREYKDISPETFAAQDPKAHIGDYRRETAHQTALDITAQFGRPGDSELGFHIPLDELPNGPLPILNAASASVTVTFRFARDFRDQRADQRRAICKLVRWLASTTNVQAVANKQMQCWLAKKHRVHLPGDVSKRCNGNHLCSPSETVLHQAHAQLSPDGREVAILRQLVEASSKTLSYSRLRSKHEVSRSRLSQCVSTLVDLGLVAKFEQTGESIFELLPLGVEFLEEVDANVGKQVRLDKLEAATGQTSEHSREDSLTAASKDEGTSHEQGYVSIGQLSRAEAAAAFAGSPRNGIGLVEYPVERKNDGREPAWYYDAEADRLVVSAEWHNPLQYTVSIARALASPKTFNNVITPDRLSDEGGLDALPINDPTLLRNSRCLGYLSDANANAEGYINALCKARHDLEELTGILKNKDNDNGSQLRSLVTREAHGLAGTLVHLLDLLGVEVIREVRIPNFNRDYSQRRTDLVKNVAIASAIQSKYRMFAAFRQLFEDRDNKRSIAINPTVNAEDPYGRLIGSITIVGPGVTDLEDRLHEALREPYQVHEDAPEFAVSFPMEDRTESLSAFQQVIRMLHRTTEYSLGRQVISFLKTFTGTPYDAADAVQGLLSIQPSTDRPERSELRRAVATLPPERIFPSKKKSVSKVVSTLLTLDGQYSQKELANEADVSTRTLRRYRDTLQELNVLHQVDSKWMFRFPMVMEESRSWEQVEEDSAVIQPSPNPSPTSIYGDLTPSSPVDSSPEILADGGMPNPIKTDRSGILMGPEPRQMSLQDAVEK